MVVHEDAVRGLQAGGEGGAEFAAGRWHCEMRCRNENVGRKLHGSEDEIEMR